MKMTYEIALPDGSTRTRSSARTYTHAVVAQGDASWAVVAFCGSHALAERQLADWRRCAPTEPAQIVPTRVVVPLTERQREFLIEIGDRTIEVLGTSNLTALVKRGLLDRSYIGMRYWRVRRTPEGRRAVDPTAK